MTVWTAEQKKLLVLADYPERWVLAYGSTGTGKTKAALMGYLRLMQRHRGKLFGFMAKTMKLVQLTVMPELRRLCREYGLPFSKVKGQPTYRLGDNFCAFFGGADVVAAERIQSLTLAGCYVDEVYNIHREVIEELDNRLRGVPDAKCVLTGNPDAPSHWFKRDWVDQADALGMRIIHIVTNDNPAISQAFHDSIARTNRGANYIRRVLGRDAARSGLVYPDYAPPAPFALADSEAFYLAVDPADSGPTHALLIGRAGGSYWLAAEWYWEGREHGQISHAEKTEKIRAWLDSLGVDVTYAVADSENPAFALDLSRALQRDVHYPDKDIVSGVTLVRYWLEHGWLRLSDKVPRLLAELQAYQWDDKAAERGEDKPIKINDHAMDAMRYGVMVLNKKKGWQVKHDVNRL